MNFNSIRFSCTALAGTKKQGRLPKDSDGYYTLPVGGLNVFNSAGDYYTAQGAKELFVGSSPLMRRISSGCLKSEEGHPKQEPGMSLDQYAMRVLRIEETRVCAHIAEIWLDFNSIVDEMNRPVIAIMAKVAPSGPFADSMQRSFENPKEDVCFSIRAFTSDSVVHGVRQRVLEEVVTWDRVTEPGINMARKYRAPSLESYMEQDFTRENISNALHQSLEGMAMESMGAVAGLGLMKKMGFELDRNQLPRFLKW